MKICPQCKKNEIEDKYSMCMSCLNQTKSANQNVDTSEILKKLEQINWNFGTLVKQQRLFYLFQISENFGNDRDNNRKRISEYFAQDIEKDLKQLKQIKEEQER
tara:strand:+ start:2250 stop:2561 length:312 start_codon:yes stop_codon:yes gene_type:complete